MTYCKTVGYAVAINKPEIPNENNVFIITLDGFRWQELFYGADSSLIHNADFTKDSVIVKQFFWDENFKERRKKLMPFFWNVIARDGQLLGNRLYNNKVNVSNIYSLSYPGYNEIFTGNTDLSIFCNLRINNRNTSFLEYLDHKPSFRGKVASFTSWSLFPYIFNKRRSKFFINSHDKLFETFSAIMKDDDNNSIRNDFETYTAARNYIISHHPRLVHVGLSGADTYGHKKQYDHYLYQAHLADEIISGLWELVQASSFYRNKTTLVVTTDHGRGASDNNWYKHGLLVKGSSQTWAALLGTGVRSIGECKRPAQLYQKQLAGTIGYFLNITSFNNYTFPISYLTATGNTIANKETAVDY
jgi:hypothetical protein